MEISCWNQTGVGMVEVVVEVVSLEEEERAKDGLGQDRDWEVSLEEEEAKDGLGQDRDRVVKYLRGAKAQVSIKEHEVVARKSNRAVVVKIFMVVEI
jgi:Tfp pilus assembly PilM family ATPase